MALGGESPGRWGHGGTGGDDGAGVQRRLSADGGEAARDNARDAAAARLVAGATNPATNMSPQGHGNAGGLFSPVRANSYGSSRRGPPLSLHTPSPSRPRMGLGGVSGHLARKVNDAADARLGTRPRFLRNAGAAGGGTNDITPEQPRWGRGDGTGTSSLAASPRSHSYAAGSNRQDLALHHHAGASILEEPTSPMFGSPAHHASPARAPLRGSLSRLGSAGTHRELLRRDQDETAGPSAGSPPGTPSFFSPDPAPPKWAGAFPGAGAAGGGGGGGGFGASPIKSPTNPKGVNGVGGRGGDHSSTPGSDGRGVGGASDADVCAERLLQLALLEAETVERPPTSKPELGASFCIEDGTMVDAVSQSLCCLTVSDPGQDQSPMVFVSPGFVQLTGYSREELLGRSIGCLHAREAEVRLGARHTRVRHPFPVSCRLSRFTFCFGTRRAGQNETPMGVSHHVFPSTNQPPVAAGRTRGRVR